MSGDDGGISGIPNDSHLRDTTHEDSMSGWPSSNPSTTILYKLEGKTGTSGTVSKQILV